MEGPKKKVKHTIPRGYGKQQIEERWKLIEKDPKYQEGLKLSNLEERKPREELLDEDTLSRAGLFNDNIENFIGVVKVPLGIKIFSILIQKGLLDQ